MAPRYNLGAVGTWLCVAGGDHRWYSRKVLTWQVSNARAVGFCVDCLATALNAYGMPEIFNTDQGSQFTRDKWLKVLQENGITISMDGRGRALDNIFVERLWRRKVRGYLPEKPGLHA